VVAPAVSNLLLYDLVFRALSMSDHCYYMISFLLALSKFGAFGLRGISSLFSTRKMVTWLRQSDAFGQMRHTGVDKT